MKFKDMIEMPRDMPKEVIKGRFKIKKAVDDEMLAFGWASVAVRADGEQIEDWHTDMIDPEDLENAAYIYVENYRDGGEMHERSGVGHIVESMVFTPEKLAVLGLDEGTLPAGWWIGMRVTDTEVWKKVKDGTYSMFSIEGEAVREKIKEEV
ncbi:MAG: XkdF-like putative serine protease domain-containing protein [bacterium]|nr:XkdF-like putative serine protease domain-containing protein [bacterium]